jgi:hypothetical protein
MPPRKGEPVLVYGAPFPAPFDPPPRDDSLFEGTSSGGLCPPTKGNPFGKGDRYEVAPEYPDWLTLASRVDAGQVPAGRAALVQKVPGGWVVMGPRGENRVVVKEFEAVVRALTVHFGDPR